MFNLKEELESMFEITDLGDPAKIVGIEITRTPDSITIAQKQYILSILQQEGMQDANPVSTPLDPGKNSNQIQKEQMAIEVTRLLC